MKVHFSGSGGGDRPKKDPLIGWHGLAANARKRQQPRRKAVTFRPEPFNHEASLMVDQMQVQIDQEREKNAALLSENQRLTVEKHCLQQSQVHADDLSALIGAAADLSELRKQEGGQ